jgi:hypothetical protein
MKIFSNFKKKLAVLSLLAASFVPAVVAPVVVYAQTTNSPQIEGGLCSGSNFEVNPSSAGDQGCTAVSGTGDRLTNLIKLVINIISIIVAVVAVIMIIFGGLKYITSGGESSNVSGAKNTILYAIIGLVVVALAQFVVRFVLDKTINAANGA